MVEGDVLKRLAHRKACIGLHKIDVCDVTLAQFHDVRTFDNHSGKMDWDVLPRKPMLLHRQEQKIDKIVLGVELESVVKQ